MRAVTTLLAVAACLPILGGCGRDEVVDRTRTVAFDAVPPCEEAFAEGAVLSEDYAGCFEGAQLMAAGVYDCHDGRELVYSEVGWGFRGGEAHPMGTALGEELSDAAFTRALDDCKHADTR